jgi:hypothetical protein
MVVPIIVVVVDLEDLVDGEIIRFVAIANMRKAYHGKWASTVELTMNFPDAFHRKIRACL